MVTVYTPNAKDNLSRLALRHKTWDPAFLAHCKLLEKKKPVIFCGDLAPKLRKTETYQICRKVAEQLLGGPVRHEFDPGIGLHHSHANVLCTTGSVEVTGAHERTTLLGKALGKVPAVAGIEPQVEATGRQRHLDTRPLREDARHRVEAASVDVSLGDDVLVTERPARGFDPARAAEVLTAQLGVASLDSFGLEGMDAAVGAAGALWTGYNFWRVHDASQETADAARRTAARPTSRKSCPMSASA